MCVLNWALQSADNPPAAEFLLPLPQATGLAQLTIAILPPRAPRDEAGGGAEEPAKAKKEKEAAKKEKAPAPAQVVEKA
jgi:hypothetical protein